jgi:peroxiredoxin
VNLGANIVRRIYFVIFVVIALVGAGLLTHYGLHASGSAAGHSVATRSANSPKGKIAPDFVLRSLDGPTVKLSDFRGKPVLLNFWATWCAPCRIEMPWFVEFYKQYQSQGLEIVGVSMDDSGQETAIAEFIKERNVNYPILRGNNEVADLYGGLRFLPQTFFVDREGNIVRTSYGIKSKEEFEQGIREFLGERDGRP